MSEIPSLPLFTDAYLADTRHLTAQEHGAYLLLLMMAWRAPNCRLPDDDAKLAKWAGVDARTWSRIKPTIMEFWTPESGHWTQRRLAKEREFVSMRAEVARKNGKHGGRPKSLNTRAQENPAGSSRVSQTKAPNPNPNPIEIEPIAQQPIAARAAPPNRYDRLLDQLLEANGLANFRAEKSPGLANLSSIIGLLEAGYDLERDILQTIRSRRKLDVRSWSYFVEAIREAGDTRRGIASQPKPQQQAEPWADRLRVFREDGTWGQAWGPKPGEVGCRVPAELLSEAA